MSRRSLSILAPPLSGNSLARAYLLAKMLEDEFRVHIVGCGTHAALWEPLRNDGSIEYRPFAHATIASFFAAAPSIARRLVDGDLIVAVKPHLSSFGLGLIARRATGKPLLLDLDDWETAQLSDSIYWEVRAHGWRWLWSIDSPLGVRVLERGTGRGDALTVSNSILQKRFGGTWIPHAHDENDFTPSVPASPADAPASVMFLGTARPHKGLDQLLAAWRFLEHPRAILRIVGTAADSPVLSALRPAAGDRVRFEHRPVPFDQVPAMLASASVVVVPQRDMPAAAGQLPMKLIAAMAVGRPIVATTVGDIPEWLADGAGVLVKAGDSPALARAIDSLLSQPITAAEMGARARQRFLQFGSFAAVRPRLIRLCSDLIAGRPLAPPAAAFSLATVMSGT